jgi:AraC-like DNA-binding protein
MKQHPQSYFRDHQLSTHHCDGRENMLPFFHFHNEMEINFLARGEIVYNYGGRAIPLPPRSLTVFWGGVSHRFEDWKPGGELWSVHIPWGWFLSWSFPCDLTRRLLQGDFIHAPASAAARADAEAMRRWSADIHDTSGDSRHRLAALLFEVRARLLRLALDFKSLPATERGGAPATGVNRMLHEIAGRFRDPGLDVVQIARHAGLTPNHANACFRKTCGTTLMRYVNLQRVSHAQCLLAAGDAKLLEVALESGFGSASQFYHVFREITGASPRDHMRTYKVSVARSIDDVIKFTTPSVYAGEKNR